jgi:type I restriction enzyme S subunit
MKFKLETEFQESEIGRIPKEWKVMRLGDISRIVSGYTFPLEMQGKTDGKYPFIKVNDMNSSYKYIDNAENYIDEIDLPILKARPFPVGTIIFPKIGMAIRLNKFRILKREALFDNNIAGIIVYNEKAHNEYLYYYLQGRIDLMSLAGMTTVPSITKTKLEKLLIPLPPLKEQEKIAEILSTVDRTIEVVDAGVARLEGLKKALMRELLTGRIRVREENGKTVFYRETEFQDTEIGKIPKDWKAVKLKEIVEPRKEIVEPNQVEPFTPYVGLEHVESGEVKLKRFGKAEDVKSTKLKFYKKDILYGKLRPYLDKAVISDINGVCSTDFIVMKTIYNVLPEYLIWILHSERFIRYSIQSMRGTNHPRTSWESLANFIVHLPPMIEQKAIANILFAVERLIELYDEEKARLERLKKKLMDLLLTGRVRVVEE